MIQHLHSHRRADRGTLIVRASVVAAGIAVSVGSQLSEPEPKGSATSIAGSSPSMLCADANGSFASL